MDVSPPVLPARSFPGPLLNSPLPETKGKGVWSPRSIQFPGRGLSVAAHIRHEAQSYSDNFAVEEGHNAGAISRITVFSGCEARMNVSASGGASAPEVSSHLAVNVPSMRLTTMNSPRPPVNEASGWPMSNAVAFDEYAPFVAAVRHSPPRSAWWLPPHSWGISPRISI